MKKIYLLSLLLISQMFVLTLLAQTTDKPSQVFKLGVEIRPRMEFFHGYKKLAATDQLHGLSVSQRNRINLEFNNKNFKTKLTLQDVHVWGSEQQLVANQDNATSIHEAWGEALISESFSVKFGRQEIIYDDHRIFGSVNWAQQARSHDAVVFKYNSGKFKSEFAFAYNQDGVNLAGTNNIVNPKNYKAFQNIWMNYKINKMINVSFIFLNNGKQLETGGDAYSQTIGPRISFKKGAVASHASYYYQGGVNNNQDNGSAQKINASYFAFDVSYKFSNKFSAVFGLEELSGNSQLENNTETQVFTPFYGTNHKFNGHMDYFFVGNGHGNVGLQDIYLQLNAKLPKCTIGLHAHSFSALADVANTDGTAMDKRLGTEIDLFLVKSLTNGIKVKAGYSQMFATETMATLKGGDINEMNNWGYIMILFSPTLFKHAK